MSTKSDVTVTGDRQVVDDLRGMRDRARDLGPAWRGVGDVVRKTMSDQFRSGGATLGKPWAPLDTKYVRRKRAQGLSPKILVATGKMRRGFTRRPMNIERYGKTSADFGSSSTIARYHHFGTRNLPARPILFRTSELVRRMNEPIADWIIKGDAR